MCAPSWTAWLHPRRRCKPVEPKACTTQRSIDCVVYGGCRLIAVDGACRGRQHSVTKSPILSCARGRSGMKRPAWPRHNVGMNIVILDDYQDAVRKLHCATRLDAYSAKVYTNTVKGLGQLSVRLKDADVIVLVRERTHITRQLIEKPGRVGSHIDVGACTERGVAVAEGIGSPVAPAELTWALTLAAMRRLPQYISNLKHGAWQQSGPKGAPHPPNSLIGLGLGG